MLGVVARVDLVRREVDEVGARRRHVDVQHDAATEATEVVVERPPRLVGDRFDGQLLAGRQVDDASGERAQDRQQVVDDGCRERAVHEVARAPRLPALEERAVAGQQLVEPRVHVFVDALGRPLRPHAITALDLVEVGDVVAGEHVRVGRATAHLVVEPAVRKLGEQRVGVGRELGGVDCRLRVDLLLQLGRAVVGVDQPVDVLAEP